PARRLLCEAADRQIDGVEVVVVDAPQLVDPLWLLAELLERVDRPQVEELAEAPVARHTALTDAQDVGRSEIDDLTVGPVKLLQNLRVVVQRQRARVRVR